MPRITIPSYRLHKASGQAVVTIRGRDYYLGPHGTAESKRKYQELIAEKLAVARAVKGTATGHGGHTVADLAVLHNGWARKRFASRKTTSHAERIATAMQYLTDRHGEMLGDRFGPRDLKDVRAAMIREGLSRTYINRLVECIRRCFKAAAADELIPHAVWAALTTVEGLRRGESPAPEPEKIRPVSEADVASVLEFASPPIIADMVRIQLNTGMRSKELCELRPCEVDRTGPGPWLYRPATHKTEETTGPDGRPIFIGPAAQAVLAKYLVGRESDAFCFVPTGKGRPPGPHYTTGSYRQAVQRACARRDKACDEIERLAAKLGVTLGPLRRVARWFPYQLRHSAATKVRAKFGAEVSRAVLGHTSLRTTEIYAERDMKAAAAAMAEIG